MEDNCESGIVPSLSFVVEQIYSSCDIEKNDAVSASALVDFVRPLMSNHPTGISEFLQILDPNDENPPISRSTFYEAMQKWIVNIEGSDNLSHFSFRELNISDEKKLPFCQSTPKPSLDPLSTQNMPNILNFSNFSATSFSSCNKSASTVACENLVLEEKVKELEHKYGNALNELSMVKSQLTCSEEQYADLKQDLDRTNRRLMLEQQIIADLQKSIEHNDDFKEEIINTKKENEHLQKKWASAKKENSNLIALIRDLEFEKEQFERKMNDIRKKDDKRKQELTDLQMALSLCEEENKALKKFRNELEDKVNEQMSLLNHFTELSEIMRNENQTLRLVVNKAGLADLSDPSSMKHLPNLSPHETSSTSLSSGNAVCETFDDWDRSIVSEKQSFKGQDLLSELQACKLLENNDGCYVREHEEFSIIVKEHENCSKIIEEYKHQIEVLTKDRQVIKDEHQNLLVDHNNLMKDSICLKERLNDEKNLNEHLSLENFNLTKRVANHVDTKNEKQKQLNEFETKIKELLKEIEKIKNKNANTHSQYTILLEKFDCLTNEKIAIENQMEQMKIENEFLFNEINHLHAKNNTAMNTIESKDKEIQDLRNVITENVDLKEEIRIAKERQIENCRIIEGLTEKIEQSKNMGHHFVQMIKKKITDQKTKVEYLNELNMKLEKQVNELKIELERMRTELYQLKFSSKEILSEKPEGEVTMEDESTSTEGSETNLSSERPQFRKRQSCIRKSNYEKQQLKIMKLEEQVDILQSELFHEKAKNSKISDLEFEVKNLELEKINLEQEKNIISKQLDTFKYDLSLKGIMMEELEESHKIEIDNFNNEFLKEKELMSAHLMEAQQRTEENEIISRKLIEELKKKVINSEEEKTFLKHLLDKQETKIVTLKKTLSDIAESSEETKGFENFVIEKESMLQFSRELLVKSNNSLQLSENCVCSLNLLLDHCKVVLVETAGDLFSATKEAFDAWKNNLTIFSEDIDLVNAMKSLDSYEAEINSEFTEEKIEKVNCNLLLSTKLLRALAQKSGTLCGSCRNDTPALKGVNKFTLRPPKLHFRRMPSSDPDISSSCMKEGDSPQAKDNIEFNIEEITKDEINSVATNMLLKQNDSITDWLGHHTNNLREALKNRKMTEKNFYHLASTWKTTLENAKNKYYNLKHQCSKVRDSYFRILLQIVTYLKNHKCHQEQNSLIQALKLIEKLKDLIFDVFKLAEQFGASRQELHSMKCWHFIVEYVNGVHKENEQLKLFQYIRCVQSRNDHPYRILRSRDVSTETDNSDELFVFSSDADFDIRKETQSTLMLQVSQQRSSIRMLSEKCTNFSMMILSIICFIAIFIIYIHVECIRNGNGSIVCPLDFLVSVRRVQSEYHPH